MAVVFALAIVEIISPALQNWHDTQTYGYPRTTHARTIAGHGDPAHPYSDYIGVNLKCSLYVVELGESGPGKQVPHLYYIAHFVGPNCDLIAITSITFADENGDGKVDMLIVANNTLYILYNDGTTFRQSSK
ncbi:hypothetical protein KSF_083950 [Reticulibacter mediterranei]|uniref:VCBS repeat-containing protein n=1 Tax=Reticulibacter mediterranei TaxID=2778369 RepID=A0A8J3N4L9_9CHLR|nr:hypothetical protein KSF_083950 [Reticulibacter mediterranei]